MFGNNQSPNRFDRIIQYIITLSLILLIGLMIANVVLQLKLMWDDSGVQAQDQNEVLERAQDALGSAQLILSFLEGSTLLIVLGLGAAAIFGYRNSSELRDELGEELSKVNAAREEMETIRDEVVAEMKNLGDVAGTLAELKVIRAELSAAAESIQPVFVGLLQANQELSLKNYAEAYRFVTTVLNLSPKNVQALYVAGWLEIQYIPGKLPDGLEHLNSAMHIDPDSPSIKAAYGVGLRRKALNIQDELARAKLFTEAEGYLLQALGQNPNLIDLNRESFWGPVGGIQRDTDRIETAIKSYERALQVTPGSSYPMGNLASLYLLRAKQYPELREKALDAFENTDRFSRAELAFMPKDYFLMMDTAMANAILGQRDPAYFDTSREWLEGALAMDATEGMLRVSLNGWKRLFDSCPADWEAVRNHLEACIAEIDTAIATRRASDVV